MLCDGLDPRGLKMLSRLVSQGNRLASRGGFDTNLAHLDHYRGRDPVRAFGSTKMEHQVLVTLTICYLLFA